MSIRSFIPSLLPPPHLFVNRSINRSIHPFSYSTLPIKRKDFFHSLFFVTSDSRNIPSFTIDRELSIMCLPNHLFHPCMYGKEGRKEGSFLTFTVQFFFIYFFFFRYGWIDGWMGLLIKEERALSLSQSIRFFIMVDLLWW